MKATPKYLPRDLKALRYLDALKAGDLEAVSGLWDEASHDPELERMLVELDGALFPEIVAGKNSLTGRPERRQRPWAAWGVALATLAAACLLAILAWPWRDNRNSGGSPPTSPTRKELARQSPDVSHDVVSFLDARRGLDDAAMPRFVWPLENRLSASTPLDRLD